MAGSINSQHLKPTRSVYQQS